MKADLVKESFKKALSYLNVWPRAEGAILMLVAFGIFLPMGGQADVVIAVAVAIWGLVKLLRG